MSLFPEKHKPSWWTELLTFLWEGGFRSLVVLVVVSGAVVLTFKKDTVCNVPTIITTTNPTTNVKQEEVRATENPVCSRYFELVSLVVGGYLGLSAPNSKSTTKSLPLEDNNHKQEES